MGKSRVFLYLLLSLTAGVALRSFVAIPLVVVWAGMVIATAAAAVSLLRQKKLVVFCFLLVAFLAGIFRFAWVESKRPDLSSLYGEAASVEGVVVKEPERAKTFQRLTVRVEEIGGDAVVPFDSLVTMRKYPAYKIGDELRLEGVLERPANLGEFDYAAYLSRQNIFSTIFLPKAEKIGEWRGNKTLAVLSRAKDAFEDNLSSILPEPHAAFLKGLTLGDRESLPSDLTEAFNRTGTAHIVALSGYNITLVGRFFMALFLFVTLPFQAAFWAASLGIVIFVVLTGASPSVVRAGVMGVLALIAGREGRAYHMANALAFAGALMVFHNPMILRFDAAFQLSFLATLGLVYLTPHIERMFSRLNRRSFGASGGDTEKGGFLSWKKVLIETLSAQIMVLPLLIYLFGRISVISPLTNLTVLVAVPYSMVLGFIAGFLGFIWPQLGHAVGWTAWAFLEYKIRLIEFFGLVPISSVETGRWAAIPLVMIYAVMFWRIRKSRHAR